MQKVTVTSFEVAIKKFIFCICNCMVDSDVAKSDISLVLGIFDACGQTHMSWGMDCIQFEC